MFVMAAKQNMMEMNTSKFCTDETPAQPPNACASMAHARKTYDFTRLRSRTIYMDQFLSLCHIRMHMVALEEPWAEVEPGGHFVQ